MNTFESIPIFSAHKGEEIRVIKPSAMETPEWKRLDSFVGLPTIETLKTLNIRRTSIESFFGANPQPNLAKFVCSGTPLSQYKHIPLMAVIVFGNKITHVNGQPVDSEIIDLGNELRPELLPLLTRERWVVTSVNPIKLLNIVTRRRRNIFSKAQEKTVKKPKILEEEDPENTAENRSSSRASQNSSREVPPDDDKSYISKIATDDEIRNYLHIILENEVEERTRIRERKENPRWFAKSEGGFDYQSYVERDQYAESVVAPKPKQITPKTKNIYAASVADIEWHANNSKGLDFSDDDAKSQGSRKSKSSYVSVLDDDTLMANKDKHRKKSKSKAASEIREIEEEEEEIEYHSKHSRNSKHKASSISKKSKNSYQDEDDSFDEHSKISSKKSRHSKATYEDDSDDATASRATKSHASRKSYQVDSEEDSDEAPKLKSKGSKKSNKTASEVQSHASSRKSSKSKKSDMLSEDYDYDEEDLKPKRSQKASLKNNDSYDSYEETPPRQSKKEQKKVIDDFSSGYDSYQGSAHGSNAKSSATKSKSSKKVLDFSDSDY